MKEQENPLVTFGIPVYNGEKHIGLSIEAILNQDYENVKVVVCDDGSTDGTAEACREYCKKDERVEFHGNPDNVGASSNFNRLFRKIETEYFAFLPHDDLIAPNFVSTLLPVLKNDPQVIVACGGLRHVDEHGKPLPGTETVFPEAFGKDSFSPVERAIRRFNNVGTSGIYWLGLHRRSNFGKTKLCLPGIHTCHATVVTELACQGPFAVCDAELFFYRKHQGSGTQRVKQDPTFTVPRWPSESDFRAWVDELPLSQEDLNLFKTETKAKLEGNLEKDFVRRGKGVDLPKKGRSHNRNLSSLLRSTKRAIQSLINA